MKIKIVTAFYDIGRSEWPGFERTPDEYFEAFKTWSQLKNDIVVYTYPEMAERILSLERENITTVSLDLDTIKSFYPSMYEKMKRLQSDESFLKYRRWFLPGYPENNADYNFLTAMKAWFLSTEGQYDELRGRLYDYYAWIDFGFNHKNSEQYPVQEEFDQLWENDKLKASGYFFGHNLDNIPNIFDVVRNPGEYIMGGIFLVANHYVPRFSVDWENAVYTLLDVDFMDDDQTILLMILKDNEKIVLCESDWCLGLKQLGCKLTSKADIQQFSQF